MSRVCQKALSGRASQCITVGRIRATRGRRVLPADPWGMTGNMSLASRILRQHNATWRKSADVSIARLEFDLAGQPEHKQTLRRIVPTRFPTPVGT
jgi:hypothetical protein